MRDASRGANDHYHLAIRPDIEGLRAIAILLVVAYHVGVPGVGGGYIGVDVFFVLSGYLITRLLVEEEVKKGCIDFLQFYARRARRLLPAAVVMCSMTLLVGWLTLSPLEMRDLTISVACATAYVSNLWFAYGATNYLANDSQSNPVLHCWSLAVEEQFYLVWPFLLAATMVWHASRRQHQFGGRHATIAAISIVSVMSFILCVCLTRSHQAWAFFGLPTRVWEFGIGALASVLSFSWLTACPWRLRALAILGIAGICLPATLYSTDTHFPGSVAILPTAATICVLISGTAPNDGLVDRLLKLRVVQWLGGMSYSWYLWHWPVLTYLRVLRPEWDGIGNRAVAVAAALLIAAASTLFIERPIRYSRYLVARPAQSVLAGVTLTAIGTLWALIINITAAHEAREPGQITYTDAHLDSSQRKTGCTLGFWETDQIRPCEFGDRTSTTTIVLYGDSHAGQWFTALERLSYERHWKLIALIKSACPTPDVPIAYQKLGRQYKECSRWRAAMEARIEAIHPRAVVMSNSNDYVVRQGAMPSAWTVGANEWRDGLQMATDRLTTNNIPVLIIQDVLRPGFDVPECLARRAWSRVWGSSTCTFLRRQSLNAAAMQSEQAAVEGNSLAALFDPNDRICNAETCDPIVDKLVAYKDSNHITAVFGLTFKTALSREMDGLLAKASESRRREAPPQNRTQTIRAQSSSNPRQGLAPR